MAIVQLGRYELERYGLPDVCICCGGPAATRRPITFSWHPVPIYAVILFGFPGLLLYLVLMAALTRRRKALVPFCTQHQRYWRARNLMFYVGLPRGC